MGTHAGNPANWQGDQAPSRSEALLLAARAAAAAGDTTIPAEAAMARAAQSQAWSAVAALAQEFETFDLTPTPVAVRDMRGTPTPGCGTAYCTADHHDDPKCGHDQVVFRSGVSWVHPMNMGTCDRPPEVAP
jgi:hypothetical protein